MVLLLMLHTGSVWAEAVRRAAPGHAALAKMQSMYQEVKSERDALAADKISLEKKRASLNKQLLRNKKKRAKIAAVLSRYKDTDKALRERLGQSRERFEELAAKFRKTIQTLKQVEGDRSRLKETLGQRNEELKACVKKNIDIYQTNLKLLDQYKNKGIWDALLQREPVTQLKRVEIENVIERYQRRLDRLQISSKVSK